MRIIYTILGTTLFILLTGFALKNAYPVTLFYYLGASWQAPFSLILFIVFMSGIVASLIAIMPTFIKLRRELNRLRNENVYSNKIQGEK